jgi:small-conductance mechanosensitive channel
MTKPWEYLRSRVNRMVVGSVLPAVVAALVLCGFSFSGLPAAAQGMPRSSGSEAGAEAVKPVVLPEHLTRAEVRELLSRLSDEEVRQLLVQQLDKVADLEVPAGGDEGQVATLQQKLATIHGRLSLMVSAIAELPSLGSFVVDRLIAGKSASHLWTILLFTVVVFGVGGVGEWLFRHLFARMGQNPSGDRSETSVGKLWILLFRAVIDVLGIAVFGLCAAGTFFAFYQDHAPTRALMATLFWIVIYIRLVRAGARFLLAPSASSVRLPPLGDEAARGIYRRVVVLAGILIAAVLASKFFDQLGVDEGMSLLIGRIVGFVVLASVGVVVWHDREVVARMIRSEPEEEAEPEGGEEPPSRMRSMLAANWHVLTICYLVAIWLSGAVTRLLTGGDTSTQGIISLGILVAVPIADRLMRLTLSKMLGVPEASAAPVEAPVEAPAGTAEVVEQAGEEAIEVATTTSAPAFGEAVPAAVSRATVAARAEYQKVLMRNFRIVLAVVVFLIVAKVWDVNIHAAAAHGMGETLAGALVNIVIAVILASAGWGIIKTAITQKIREEEPHAGDAGEMEGEAGGKGGTRLQTLLPLFQKFLFITLIVIVALMILAELGVDIGPLIAGAGVVGIAIGFGAQTLVKDIVSGLFFLMDDAFRVGEYIDVGSVRGVVEGISVRSLRLRHQNGPVHTVPFGAIQHLTNYSRDWAIMKLEVRVPFDTDMEKVRKIVKKVGQELMADPDHGKNFLQPLKSQGVNRMDDSAFIVRVKFMARPGEQFLLRREVFRRIQEAFADQGIKFAPRRVIVDTGGGEGGATAAAAAHAVAASDADAQSKGAKA